MPHKMSSYQRQSIARRARLWKFERLETRALLAAADEISVPFLDLIPVHFGSDYVASVTGDSNTQSKDSSAGNPMPPTSERVKTLAPEFEFADAGHMLQGADAAMSSTDDWILGDNITVDTDVLESPLEPPNRSDETTTDEADNDTTLSDGDPGSTSSNEEDEFNSTNPGSHSEPGLNGHPSILLDNQQRTDATRPSTVNLLSPATKPTHQVASSDAVTENVTQSQRALFNYFVTTEHPQSSRPSLSRQTLGSELTHDTYMTLMLLTSRNEATTGIQRVERASRGQDQSSGSQDSVVATSDQDRCAGSANVDAYPLRAETQAAMEDALRELHQIDVIAGKPLHTVNAFSTPTSLPHNALVATAVSPHPDSLGTKSADASVNQRPWIWSVFTVTSLMLTTQHLQGSNFHPFRQHIGWLNRVWSRW